MFVETFLNYLRYERNASDRTIGEYEDDLKAFESYFRSLDDTLTWENLDTDVAREWMVSMMEKGNKASSVQRRLSALRSFYRFLLRRGLVKRDPVHSLTPPKKDRVLPAFIRDEEMQRLLETPGMFSADFDGMRDKLIVATFYETGLRLSELIGLNIQDVRLDALTLKVTGKGNKQRVIPFGPRLRELFLYYIGTREEKVTEGTDNAFFISAAGERLKPPTVRKMVKAKLGLVTTQKKRSPHVLRHTFATSMLNHQADLESVKELLGHESLSTTEIYTHTTFEELKKVYEQAHPRK